MSKYVTFDLDVERMSRAELEDKYFDAVFALEELGVGKSDLEDKIPHIIGLTRMQSQMLALLMSGRVISARGFMAVNYAGGQDATDSPIKVRIHQIRERLEPYGVMISTVKLKGYVISKADIQKIHDLLDAGVPLGPPKMKARKPHRKWSEQEVEYLNRNYRSPKDCAYIAQHLDRTVFSIKQKAYALCITKPRNTEHST